MYALTEAQNSGIWLSLYYAETAAQAILFHASPPRIPFIGAASPSLEHFIAKVKIQCNLSDSILEEHRRRVSAFPVCPGNPCARDLKDVDLRPAAY